MAKGPKTQAAVDLLVSSGSFFFLADAKIQYTGEHICVFYDL